MIQKKSSLLYIILILLSSCSFIKNITTPKAIVVNTTEAKINPPVKVLGYSDVITKDAQTKYGMFNVSMLKGRYFFEIPDSLLGRQMLVINRFIKTPTGYAKYGGEQISERLIFWELGPANNVFLRISTVINRADSTDAISKAVNNSNLTPILAAFDIKAKNKDRKSTVIDVTDFINSDNTLFAVNVAEKSALNLGGIEKDKTYIDTIKPFAFNIEIKSVKTYKAIVNESSKSLTPAALLSGSVTIEINNSIVLLPKTPMKKRYYDQRVGYFATSYNNYSDQQQKVNMNTFINRWRLEPKAADLEKWKRGELVEPKKQIVYYIDPATPEKWVKYLIEGINDWQVAFEQAGFKNAIVGKRWDPKNDTLSLEDARFSVIRYFASPVQNAYGPSIVDPRSGEILESHIGWYHNVMSLLNSWYMIQAGAVDARARKMTLDDELMGQLIRFVSSHEVGHTLGLRHNMGASSATPVERLRDPVWLKQHGHTSSIMDYARFNYVAQPEDHIPADLLMPKINDYDKWAIQWGYSPKYDNINTTIEKNVLSKLITDSLKANPRLWFSGEGNDSDPRSQTEDLGDNAIAASAYGIKNLKRILPELVRWTKIEDSDDYSNLKDTYKQVIKQYDRYMYHVVKNIGGIYITQKSAGQNENVYAQVPKKKQKEALAFLDQYAFHEPVFLANNDILNKVEAPQVKKMFNESMEVLMILLMEGGRMSRLNFNAERFAGSDPYTPEQYISDLSGLVWKELETNAPVGSYRRNLQSVYIDNIINMYDTKKVTNFIQGLLAAVNMSSTAYTDLNAVGLHNILMLKEKIKKAIPKTKDEMTKAHLQYMLVKIEKALKN